jgi:hypothetical protein
MYVASNDNYNFLNYAITHAKENAAKVQVGGFNLLWPGL